MTNLGERIKAWYNSYKICPPWSSFLGFVVREKKRQREKIKKLVVDELLMARKEGTPTSRLTNLYMKINKL